MISGADDGSVILWKIQDKEGRTIKRDKETAYAEEILITKSDLEEKNSSMKELGNRVKELKSENEYQMRLKELSHSEKIKELTEKFIQEMESLKTKNQVLKAEKDKIEASHEYQIAEVLEKHSKDLQDLESTNNQKLMVEYEKYQDLQSKTQKIQEDHERQVIEMEQSREKALTELQDHYEDLLHKLTINNEKASADSLFFSLRVHVVMKAFFFLKLQEENRQLTKEYEEVKRQIEEDADTEIVDIKAKYEKRLREQLEINEKIQSDAANIRKKVNENETELNLVIR